MVDKSFGEILDKLLKRNKISIKQFSELIDTSPKTIREWIGKGGRFPSNPKVIKQISEVLGVSIHELLYGEKEDFSELVGSLLNRTVIHSGYYKVTIEKVDIEE